jgi:methyltransferase (TIGR00027 family)
VAPWLPDHVAARTRFIDAGVTEALRAGGHQLVLVGAGFDDRPHRFGALASATFVLDRPEVLAERHRRSGADERYGTVPVPVDLVDGDPGRALVEAGYRSDVPAVLVVEGVLVYLPVDAVADLLRTLADVSAPGTVLLATLAVHPPGLESTAVVRAANARRSRGGVEPWRTILPAVEHLVVVAGAGWRIEEVRDDADVVPAARRGWSRLVAARRPAGRIRSPAWGSGVDSAARGRAPVVPSSQ